jgi:hypothetical protein
MGFTMLDISTSSQAIFLTKTSRFLSWPGFFAHFLRTASASLRGDSFPSPPRVDFAFLSEDDLR